MLHNDLQKDLGKRWKAMSEEEKKPYFDQNAKAKAEYAKANAKKKKKSSPKRSSQKKRKKSSDSPSLSSSNSSPIEVTLKSPRLRNVSKSIECPISKYSRLTLPNLIENLARCYSTQHVNVIHSFIATSGHIRAACNYLSQKTMKKECEHCSQYARNIPVWNAEDDRVLLASEKDISKDLTNFSQKLDEICERRGSNAVVHSRMDFLESL